MKRRMLSLILISLLIVLIGCSEKSEVSENGVINDTSSKKEEVEDGGYIEEVQEEEINKSEEGYGEQIEEIGEAERKLCYGEGNVLERIYEYLGQDAYNMGFMYYNLATGEQISFNENQQFYAASLYKLNMNILVYDYINEGKLSAEDMLYLEYYPDEAGNEFIDYSEYLEATELGVLLDNTIINSDNTAAAMIYHYLGGWTSYREQYFSFFNIDNPIYTDDTTVGEEFIVLKYLYDNREREGYSHLIEVMKETAFHDRIDKYVPQELVAHKVGNYEDVVNDEGIVFTDEPYIIIFLTEGVGYASEVIANISRAIYLYNIS